MNAKLISSGILLAIIAQESSTEPRWALIQKNAYSQYEQRNFESAALLFESVANSDAPLGIRINAAEWAGHSSNGLQQREKQLQFFVRAVELCFGDLSKLTLEVYPEHVKNHPVFAAAIKVSEIKREAAQLTKQIDRELEWLQSAKTRYPFDKKSLATVIQASRKSKGTAPLWSIDTADLNGSAVSTGRFRDQVVLVSLVSSWQWQGAAQACVLRDLANKYENRALSVIGIWEEGLSSDPGLRTRQLKEAQEFRARQNLQFIHLLADESTRNILHAGPHPRIPTTILVDCKGRIRCIDSGYRPLDHFDALLSELLMESAQSRPASKPANGR